MADPLSITGSTVGIIALGLTVVKSLYNFSNGVLLAGKEIQDLRTDTETLKEILDRFHNIFNETDPYSMTFDLQFLEKIVWRYRDKFAELDTRLETFTADRKSRGRRTLEKLKWIVERDDLRELLNQVGKMKTDLQTALLLSQRYYPMRMRDAARTFSNI
jgi:hypothetical protein